MSANTLRQQLEDLKARKAEALDRAEKCYTADGDQTQYDAEMETVKGLNKKIQKLLDDIAEAEKGFDAAAYTPATDNDKQTEKSASTLFNTIRKSEQFANAWLKALSKGISPDSAAAMSPDYKPLVDAESAFKALSIGGGTTPGEDGGFLVPVDFDLAVIQFEKDLLDLSRYTTVETVYTNSGWRNLDTTGTVQPMAKVNEMALISPQQQPSFGRIPYTVEKYADILPISNELMADAQGLIQYLAGWWAPLFVATKNSLILTELQKLTIKPFTGATDAAQVKELKSILNKELNTAYSRSATILTNQSGFDSMDNWVDNNGRGMLQPDLKDPTAARFKGRLVAYYDDDQMPAESDKGNQYNPLYVGNLKAFGRLFVRQGMRIISFQDYEHDVTKIRGTCRMDFRTVNDKAVVRTGFKV